MSFWGSFFGDDQREAIQQAQQQAQQQLLAGKNQAIGTTGDYLNQSLGFLQPDMQAGQVGRDAYMAALGLSGPGAQQGFFSNYMTDPGFQSSLDAGVQALDRSAASRGLLRSGGQQKSLFDFGQRAWLGNFGDRLNRLAVFLPLGSQAGQTAAGLTTGAGNRICDIQFGTGQLFANQSIGTGNAMAQAYGVGPQNVLGALNSVGKIAAAAAMSDARLKENVYQVGELYDGQPVYVFNFKGDDTPIIGLMAQDVEKIMPEAISEVNGYKAVRYDLATMPSRRMGL